MIVDALIFRKSDQPEGLGFYKLVTNGTLQLRMPASPYLMLDATL